MFTNYADMKNLFIKLNQMYESLFDLPNQNPIDLKSSLKFDERIFILSNKNQDFTCEKVQTYAPIESKRASVSLHQLHLPICLSKIAGVTEEKLRFSTFIKKNINLSSDMDDLDFDYDEKIDQLVVKRCADSIHFSILNELYFKNDENVRNVVI
jgi:hypothetical protein